MRRWPVTTGKAPRRCIRLRQSRSRNIPRRAGILAQKFQLNHPLSYRTPANEPPASPGRISCHRCSCAGPPASDRQRQKPRRRHARPNSQPVIGIAGNARHHFLQDDQLAERALETQVVDNTGTRRSPGRALRSAGARYADRISPRCGRWSAAPASGAGRVQTAPAEAVGRRNRRPQPDHQGGPVPAVAGVEVQFIASMPCPRPYSSGKSSARRGAVLSWSQPASANHAGNNGQLVRRLRLQLHQQLPPFRRLSAIARPPRVDIGLQGFDLVAAAGASNRSDQQDEG